MIKPARHVALSAVLSILAASLFVSPAQARTAKCQSIAATIVSSAAVINGTSGRDVIVVRGGGAHLVTAGAGEDVICGSEGVDTINGGAGNDKIFANGGKDIVDGGSGNDTIHGGTGADSIDAGVGNDKVFGDAGNDSLTGDKGNDALSGGSGADYLFGSAGKDDLSGGAGDDAVQGGPGVDSLSVGSGQNYCANDPLDSIDGVCAVDTQPPVMTSQPGNLEVAAGSTLTVSWTLEDAVGISDTWLKIGGPSGWVTEWCGFGIQGARVSGTAQNGTYSVQCDVPATAVSQQYTLFIDANDVFGSGAQSIQMPLTVTGGITDSSAPTPSAVEVSTASVNVGQTFTVSYSAADESGVLGITAWLALNGYSFADNTGRAYAEMLTYSNLISGDANSGRYEQNFSFNSYAPAGVYTVWISVSDKYGNRNFIQTQTTVTVTSAG